MNTENIAERKRAKNFKPFTKCQQTEVNIDAARIASSCCLQMQTHEKRMSTTFKFSLVKTSFTFEK